MTPEDLISTDNLKKINSFFKKTWCHLLMHDYVEKERKRATAIYDCWCRDNKETRVKKLHEYDWQILTTKICLKCGKIEDEIKNYKNELDLRLERLKKADEMYIKYKEKK